MERNEIEGILKLIEFLKMAHWIEPDFNDLLLENHEFDVLFKRWHFFMCVGFESLSACGILVKI